MTLYHLKESRIDAVWEICSTFQTLSNIAFMYGRDNTRPTDAWSRAGAPLGGQQTTHFYMSLLSSHPVTQGPHIAAGTRDTWRWHVVAINWWWSAPACRRAHVRALHPLSTFVQTWTSDNFTVCSTQGKCPQSFLVGVLKIVSVYLDTFVPSARLL